MNTVFILLALSINLALVLAECESEHLFLCANGNCISLIDTFGEKADPNPRCDAVDNCGDGSDNKNCTECKSGLHLCANGDCVAGGIRYDGGEVEPRCNKIYDCPDHSDEESCTVCPDDEILCDNKCYTKEQACRYGISCGLTEDQIKDFCGCPSDQFLCGNGKCLLKVRSYGLYSVATRCNGFDDCDDNSDEENCTVCGGGELLVDNKCYTHAEACGDYDSYTGEHDYSIFNTLAQEHRTKLCGAYESWLESSVFDS